MKLRRFCVIVLQRPILEILVLHLQFTNGFVILRLSIISVAVSHFFYSRTCLSSASSFMIHKCQECGLWLTREIVSHNVDLCGFRHQATLIIKLFIFCLSIIIHHRLSSAPATHTAAT